MPGINPGLYKSQKKPLQNLKTEGVKVRHMKGKVNKVTPKLRG